MRMRFGWAIPICAMWMLGCGNYTVTFRVAPYINTGGGGDSNTEMLDVDIVCLTPADAERYPELANGSMRSKAWFRARQRQAGAANIGSLKKSSIYAFRGEGDLYRNYTVDTRAGDPISPGAVGGAPSHTIKVHHPKALSKNSVLLIYGRFQDGKGGLADTDPIRLQPPPAWNTDVVIDIGRTQLSLVQED